MALEEGVSQRLRFPGLRAGLYPPAVLPRHRPVPLGRAVGRSRRHRQDRRQGEGTDPGRHASAQLARHGARAASPSRACRRASAGSGWATATAWAWPSTRWWRRANLKAPVVIGRDHLDSGSVASPNRETEAMKDGSDAVSDWPLLNALLNCASGATWVSIHHGGGVGMGFSQHAGMVIVCDGTRSRGQAASNACCGTIRPPASCAMPMPAMTRRSTARGNTNWTCPGSWDKGCITPAQPRTHDRARYSE